MDQSSEPEQKTSGKKQDSLIQMHVWGRQLPESLLKAEVCPFDLRREPCQRIYETSYL